MIRAKMMSDLRSVLSSSKNFHADDFSIKEESSKIIIRYEYNSEFYFVFTLFESAPPEKPADFASIMNPLSKTLQTLNSIGNDQYTYTVSLAPGKVFSTEEFKAQGTQAIFSSIKNWLTYLWQDLVSAPLERELKTQKQDIETIKKNIDQISDKNLEKFFTKEEAQTLIQKLNDLEHNITSQIEKEIAGQKQTQIEIENLKKEIENLKQMIPALNKKNWFKLYGARIFTWLSKEENRKFIKDAGKLVTPMLPDDIKGALPPSSE